MEFLTWLSQPEIERAVLLDKSLNEVVAMQTKNLLDADVNARFNGMHAFGAQALKGAKGTPPVSAVAAGQRRAGGKHQ